MKEDYLILEIQKIGQLLRRVYERLTGDVAAAIEAPEIAQTLKGQLNVDMENLAACPNDKFLETLLANKALTAANLELLADIFFELGEKTENGDEQRTLFEKCMAIYNYVNEATRTFSVNRDIKLLRLKQIFVE